MKQTIIISFLILLPYLCGCGGDFDIDGPAAGELCLICYPGPRDTTIIQLYQTVPVGGRYEGSPYLQSADITFSVDGTPQKVEQAAEKVGSVPKGCWFVPGRLDSGEAVEVSASVESAATVRASTTVPPEPPAFDYYIDFGLWTDLYIAFDDNPLTEDYYGIAIFCERTLQNASGKVVMTKHLSLYSEGDGAQGIAVIRDYVDAGFTGWSLWPKRTEIYGVRIWPDSKFTRTRVTLKARFGSAYFSSAIDGESIRYKVRLYRFSEEFYRYLVSLDYQELNDYATYGIIPMKLSFTNVTGGCGILAGWSMRESEWFEMD